MSDQRLSMRDQLEAAFSEHSDESPAAAVVNDNHEAPAPKGSERQEAVSAEPEVKAKPQKAVPQHSLVEPKKVDVKPEAKVEQKQEAKPGERERDASGKFVPKKVPGQWKKELHTYWEKPGGHTAEEWAAIQEEILRREGDYSKSESSFRQRLNDMEPAYKGFTEAFTPYKERLARSGLEPVSLVKQLLAQADFADRDFAGFVTEQARMRGFDIASLIQQQQDAPQAAPEVVALQRELAAIKNTISSQQAQVQHQTQAEVRTQVESFQNATNEDGSPKHPHFERVKVKMGSLMHASPEMTLDQAYRDACYADPEIREALLADEWEQRESKRREELARQSNAAKSNMGRTSGTTGTPLPKGSTIRAQLTAATEQLWGESRV